MHAKELTRRIPKCQGKKSIQCDEDVRSGLRHTCMSHPGVFVIPEERGSISSSHFYEENHSLTVYFEVFSNPSFSEM